MKAVAGLVAVLSFLIFMVQLPVLISMYPDNYPDYSMPPPLAMGSLGLELALAIIGSLIFILLEEL